MDMAIKDKDEISAKSAGRYLRGGFIKFWNSETTINSKTL
jgi:hypothetical protein